MRNEKQRNEYIIRTVYADESGTIIDYDGNKVNVVELEYKYNATMSPTVIFVDHKGNEIAPRILGVRNMDFYGEDFDTGLATAKSNLQQKLAHK